LQPYRTSYFAKAQLLLGAADRHRDMMHGARPFMAGSASGCCRHVDRLSGPAAVHPETDAAAHFGDDGVVEQLGHQRDGLLCVANDEGDAVEPADRVVGVEIAGDPGLRRS